MSPSQYTPAEGKARDEIDQKLAAAGWAVQTRPRMNLFQLADVGDGYFRDRSNRFLTLQWATELGCTLLEPGDVLVARMPDPLGRACVFPGVGRPAVTAVDVCILRPGTDVDKRWLVNFINAPQFRNRVSDRESGTTRKRISRKNLATIPMPVPPPGAQQRIVEVIEEQFSRLAAGVESLQRAKRNLTRLRTSILSTAASGSWETVPIGDLAA